MNTTTFQAVPQSNVRPTNWLTRYPILTALAITYAIALPFLSYDALASHNLVPALPNLLNILVGWAPAIGAIVAVALLQGKRGVGQLLRRFLIARVGVQWYAVALFGLALVILGGAWLYTLVGGTVTIPLIGVPIPELLFASAVTLVVAMLVNTEEILWRGFMQPRLQLRHTALVAALIIAVPEFVLHLPYFFNANITFFQMVGMPVFFIFTAALAVLYAWLFNNTRGSLLLVTLAHASQNTWSQLLSDNQVTPFYLTVALLVAVAVVVVGLFGAATLTRRTAKPETAVGGA